MNLVLLFSSCYTKSIHLGALVITECSFSFSATTTVVTLLLPAGLAYPHDFQGKCESCHKPLLLGEFGKVQTFHEKDVLHPVAVRQQAFYHSHNVVSCLICFLCVNVLPLLNIPVVNDFNRFHAPSAPFACGPPC